MLLLLFLRLFFHTLLLLLRCQRSCYAATPMPHTLRHYVIALRPPPSPTSRHAMPPASATTAAAAAAKMS
jgi:hypothetical protein